MRTRRRGSQPSRPSPRSTERTAADLWRAVPEVEVPARVTAAADPTALLRSLGPPALPGQANAERYMASVVERAAGLAIALAAAADLLADPDDR